MKPLTIVFKRAFGALVALVVLFEEWGWEPLLRLMARIARLPGLRQLEAWIARLPPWAALVALLLPSVLLVPVKLAASNAAQRLLSPAEMGELFKVLALAKSGNFGERAG